MAVNPQDVEGLEDETVTLWSQAEDALIGALSAAALAVSVRARSPEHARQVAAAELVRTIRPQSVAVARVLQQNTPALVEAAVAQASGLGAAAARAEVAALPAGTVPTLVPAVVDPAPAMVLPETRPQAPGSAAARGAASKAAEATTTSLGKAARNIPRNTQTVWGKIIDNAVNKTVTGDLTIQQALQQAMDDAARAGLGFYRDAAGRKWGLDTYAEMAIRTGTNNALIDAHTAELVGVGLDLVIVSSHHNPAPQCAPYERKILSLTGEHGPGTHRVDGHTVTVKDTLNGARAHGFEHPNAILGGGQEMDALGGAIGASKSTYRGPAVTIRTAKGNEVTVSPKHPVLTGRGWVTAESVRLSDHLFRAVGSGASRMSGVQSDLNKVPPTVEDEFRALKLDGTSTIVSSTGLDFNDDRQFIEGEVHVVVTEDCLLPVPDTHVIQETGEVSFVRSDMGGADEVCDRPEALGSVGVGSPLAVARPLTDGNTVGLQSSADSSVGHIEVGRDLLACHAHVVHTADLGGVHVRTGGEFHAGFDQSVTNGRVGDSQDPSTVANAVASGVEADSVVSVDVIDFSGHAYDFQTVDGVYCVNSIVVHNCRHTVTAFLPGFTDTTPPAADPGYEGYKATQKQRYYEREIRRSRRMEQAAIDDDGRKKAADRRRRYAKKLREHIRDHDLPRRRHREKLRQPGNPMPAA